MAAGCRGGGGGWGFQSGMTAARKKSPDYPVLALAGLVSGGRLSQQGWGGGGGGG